MIIEGDILETSAKYIVHQTNCVSHEAAYLAKSIFKKYPYADVYSSRQKSGLIDTPGTIKICGNGKDQRFVIALFGQHFPGKPRENQKHIDSFKHRKLYFFRGLQAISEINNLESVAFPYGIGCGAAGGDWNDYQKLIEKFADFVSDQNVKVFIYKLDQTK